MSSYPVETFNEKLMNINSKLIKRGGYFLAFVFLVYFTHLEIVDLPAVDGTRWLFAIITSVVLVFGFWLAYRSNRRRGEAKTALRSESSPVTKNNRR
jgi:hypothetical protein